MDIASKDTNKSIIKVSENDKKKVNKIVLEENEYVSKIDKIIERDFFPDLERLRLRNEYQEAVESNNLEKLRDIQIKWGKLITGSSDLHDSSVELNYKEEVSNEDSKKKIEPNLDEFLRMYNSEDNVSFSKILEEAKVKHRQKYSWLYDAQDQALQAIQFSKDEGETQLSINNTEESSLLLSNVWKYTPKNYLMYNPDGVELSDKELAEIGTKGKPAINHSNTRLNSNYNNGIDILSQAISQKSKNQMAMGHVGVDGNIEVIKTSQKSYSLVATPSPAPGVNESPIMTWGEIGGTPLKLDTPGPNFRIPETPIRDALAHKLDSANINKRKKEQSTPNLLHKLMKSGKSPLTPSQRFKYLSPAAQRLASRTGLSTPTPFIVNVTPKLTPSATPINLSKGSLTPKVSKTESTLPEDSSLTDNLLKFVHN